jgi:GAF domain-containing protein
MEDRDALQIVGDRRDRMYDPQVVDAFFAMHGQGLVAMFAQPPPLENATPPPGGPPLAPLEQGREDLVLHTFLHMGRALGGATSTSQVGEILWIHLRKHLPASAFVLYGYERTNDAIVPVYTAGGGVSSVDATPIPLGERLSGWVAATAQTVMNSDARLDLDEPAREGSSLRSALAVPIMSNEGIAGVLSFYAEAPNAFTDANRRLVEAAGRAIAESVTGLAPDFAAPGPQ